MQVITQALLPPSALQQPPVFLLLGYRTRGAKRWRPRPFTPLLHLPSRCLAPLLHHHLLLPIRPTPTVNTPPLRTTIQWSPRRGQFQVQRSTIMMNLPMRSNRRRRTSVEADLEVAPVQEVHLGLKSLSMTTSAWMLLLLPPQRLLHLVSLNRPQRSMRLQTFHYRRMIRRRSLQQETSTLEGAISTTNLKSSRSLLAFRCPLIRTVRRTRETTQSALQSGTSTPNAATLGRRKANAGSTGTTAGGRARTPTLSRWLRMTGILKAGGSTDIIAAVRVSDRTIRTMTRGRPSLKDATMRMVTANTSTVSIGPPAMMILRNLLCPNPAMMKTMSVGSTSIVGRNGRVRSSTTLSVIVILALNRVMFLTERILSGANTNVGQSMKVILTMQRPSFPARRSMTTRKRKTRTRRRRACSQVFLASPRRALPSRVLPSPTTNPGMTTMVKNTSIGDASIEVLLMGLRTDPMTTVALWSQARAADGRRDTAVAETTQDDIATDDAARSSSKRNSYHGTESFLGLRARGELERPFPPPLPTMTTAKIEISPAHLEHHDELEKAIPIFTPLPRSRSTSPTEEVLGGTMTDEHHHDTNTTIAATLPRSHPGSPDATASPYLGNRQRTPSLQNMRKTSATAVPISFRGFGGGARGGGGSETGSPVSSTSRPVSTTAIPIPFLAQHGRRASTGAHSATVTSAPRSPVSPVHHHPGSMTEPIGTVATPPPAPPSLWQKQHRKAPSTEFKSGSQFRPLYLVERNASARRGSSKDGEGVLEVEALPGLPASRSPSVGGVESGSSGAEEEWASAVEDGAGEGEGEETGTSGYASAAEEVGGVSGGEEEGLGLGMMGLMRGSGGGLRIDTGLAASDGGAREGEDWLGSQQSTPRAGVFGAPATAAAAAPSTGVDVDDDVPKAAAEKLAREQKREGSVFDGVHAAAAAAAALVGGAAAAGLAAKEVFYSRDEEKKSLGDEVHASKEDVVLPMAVEEPVDEVEKNTENTAPHTAALEEEHRTLIAPTAVAAALEDPKSFTPATATEEDTADRGISTAVAAVTEEGHTPATALIENAERDRSVPAGEQAVLLPGGSGVEEGKVDSPPAPVAEGVEPSVSPAIEEKPSSFIPPAPVEEARPTTPSMSAEIPTANILDDFMAGEPDNDAIEEAHLAAEADRQRQEQGAALAEPSVPTRPTLLTRTSSKKNKKAKRAAKLGTIEPGGNVASDAAQLTLEQAREAKRRDTEDAVADWFVDDQPAAPDTIVASPVQEDEKTQTQTPAVAEVPSVLLARETKSQEKKDKKRKKSKGGGSISETVGAGQSPAETEETKRAVEAQQNLVREEQTSCGLEVPDENAATAVEAGPESGQQAAGDEVVPVIDKAVASQVLEGEMPAETAEETLLTRQAPEDQAVPAVEDANVASQPPVEADVPTTITGENPKGQEDPTTPIVLPEANPEEEFAPVVSSSSSKKKKKGKKGKKGSTSSSGFATPLEAEEEPPAAVKEEQPTSAEPTTEQQASGTVARDVPVIPVVDERGVRGALEGGDESVVAVQPADGEKELFGDATTQLPVEPVSVESKSTAVVEADPEAEFVAVPAKGKKKKKGKKGQKSVSESPVEDVLVPAAAQASVDETVPQQAEPLDSPREVFPQEAKARTADDVFSSLAAAVPLPDVEDDKDLAELLVEDEVPEVSDNVQLSSRTFPEEPVVSVVHGDALLEQSTVEEDQLSFAAATRLPDDDRDLIKPQIDEATTESLTANQPSMDAVSEEYVPEAQKEIIPEQQTVTEDLGSFETSTPLPKDSREVAQSETRELPDTSNLVENPQQTEYAPPDADPEPEFAVVPSKKKKKKGKGKKNSAQEGIVPEIAVPVMTEEVQKDIVPEPSTSAVVEEVQERHLGSDVPLPEGNDGDLFVHQDPSTLVAAMPDDERREFEQAEEAMKIEQEPVVKEIDVGKASEAVVMGTDAAEVETGLEREPELVEQAITSQETLSTTNPEMEVEQEQPVKDLDTGVAPETAVPTAEDLETIATISKEPEPLVDSREAGETSAPPQEPASTTAPEAQPEDEWAVQPKKKKKGKKGKKANASGQSSVDITEPSTPAFERAEPEMSATLPEVPIDALVLEPAHVTPTHEPSAEFMETALSTSELPETTMVAAGATEGLETPTRDLQQNFVGNQGNSFAQEPTVVEAPTPVAPFTTLEEAANIPLPSTTDEVLLAPETEIPSIIAQEMPVEESQRPNEQIQESSSVRGAEPEAPKDATFEPTEVHSQEFPSVTDHATEFATKEASQILGPEEAKDDIIPKQTIEHAQESLFPAAQAQPETAQDVFPEQVATQNQEEAPLAAETQTGAANDAGLEQPETQVQDPSSAGPEAQPEDEWAVLSKSKKKNKKKKRGSSAQSPIQVESPAPSSPKLMASPPEGSATLAPAPTQAEPPITVDLTQPTAENFGPAREFTSAATDQPTDVTDDLRGPATPAADLTAPLSEENPSNPAAERPRDETPPYAGEWELPTQLKDKGKKSKKRDAGFTGEQARVEEEVTVPTDEQIVSSAIPVSETADSVPVVEQPVEALTEDPVATPAHHPSSTPLSEPQQLDHAEDTPRSGFEAGVEQSIGLVSVEEEQQVEQPVGADTSATQEGDWPSLMPPKKNKKGKKGKKQDSVSLTPKETEQVSEPVVEPSAETHTVETASLESAPVDATVDDLIAPTEEPAAAIEAGEDEWALPAKKKKGKKGKKGLAGVVQDAVQAKEAPSISEEAAPEQPLETKVEDDVSKSLEAQDVTAAETSRKIVEEAEPVDTGKGEDIAAPTSEDLPSQDTANDEPAQTSQTERAITEEPAQIENAPEQPKEADAEDTWTFPAAGKKNKKKKKGKQMSVEEPTALPADEPITAVEENSGELPSEKTTLAAETVSDEFQPEVNVEPTPVESQPVVEVDVEDEWAAAPSSKKGKKKKGKKGKQSSVSETPPVAETPPVVEEMSEDHVSEKKSFGAVVDAARELELAEPVVKQPAEAADQPVIEELSETPGVEELMTQEPEQGLAKEVMTAEPIVTEAPAPEVSVAEVPQEAGEDEWALPSKKKKKGKKGKKASMSSTPPVIEETSPVVCENATVETIPVTEEPTLPIEEAIGVVNDPSPATEDKPAIEEPKAAMEEPAPVAQESDPVIDEHLQIAEPAPIVPDVQDDNDPPVVESRILDDETVKDLPVSVEHVKKETTAPTEYETEPLVEEPTSATELGVAETTPVEDAAGTMQAPEETKPEDTWEALPSKKKGKKGKKGKQQSISTPPAEISETKAGPGPTRDLQVEEAPKEPDIAVPAEAVPDEEFSMPLSKKDKKKKKKASAAAAAAAAWADDTPDTQTASPAEDVPVTEIKTISAEPSTRTAPSISFAAAAGILADVLAEEKRDQAEPEALITSPRSPKTEAEVPLGVQTEEVPQSDKTAVEEQILSTPTQEKGLEEAAPPVDLSETVTREVHAPEPSKEAFEHKSESTDHEDKKSRSVAPSLGFAAAAGILADVVAESKQKESSSEPLKSTETVSEDALGLTKEEVPPTTSEVAQPDIDQLAPENPSSTVEHTGLPAREKEISSEQLVQEENTDKGLSEPIEAVPLVESPSLETTEDPDEAGPFTDFAPVKKGKKNKKKGRKSIGTTTPTVEKPTSEAKEAIVEPVIEPAEFVVEHTTSENKALETEPASLGEAKMVKESIPVNDEKRSGSPTHDVEFAAALAAGLQDSGFDPNLVLNDPTFTERKSPPSSVLEADPDESFAPAKPKKNKKKNKGLATPVLEEGLSETTTPGPVAIEVHGEEPALVDSKIQATPSQEGTADGDAFAAAMSSVLEDPAFNRRTPSPDAAKEAISDEFFPFQKRPKKKKGKKSQDISPESETVEQARPEPIDQPTPIMDTPQETASRVDFETPNAVPTEEPTSIDQPATEAEAPRDIAMEEYLPFQEQEDEWSFNPAKEKGKKAENPALSGDEEAGATPATDETTRSIAVDSPVVEAPTDVPTAVENPATEGGIVEEAKELNGPLMTNAAEKPEQQDREPVPWSRKGQTQGSATKAN
ncbi:hypothetical protein B0J12DRAFT_59780 [Macrophomina phaseolina]|uniref:Uncharacterized protein n=1 Tax=Macrophomina phaseolina TaxID=35725 RepID=A0ABQ8FQI7_9PEZI|nr:hypothetical protein B0J12DRAFT_59780 [Macrophomina phaseolina]